MGIINRTPDSFFDGGSYLDRDAAVARVLQIQQEGADIIDLGAESTRPGAPRVSAEEQISRLGTLVEFAVGEGCRVSVDTTHPDVAAWALARGASMVNSVSLASAGALGALAAEHRAELVLAHCRGSMTDMRGFSDYDAAEYDDVVVVVAREWQQAAEQALAEGLAREDLIFDPGLGFTKNAEQSLELCARLTEFRALGHPILVGTSRKSYIAHVVADRHGGEIAAPEDRLGGSIAAALACASAGADYLRVHDVAATRQALAYAAAVADRVADHGARRGGDGA